MSNAARRTSITYPNGRQVNLGSGAADSIYDLFSLVQSVGIEGEGGNKAEYTRAGLGRFVKTVYPQPAVEMSMIRPGGGSDGDSGDPRQASGVEHHIIVFPTTVTHCRKEI